MLTSKIIKSAIDLKKDQYSRSRLYPSKDGYKIKFYGIDDSVNVSTILKSLQNCDIFNDFQISYSIIENLENKDLIIDFVQNVVIPYGLKELKTDLDEQISLAAYFLAEKRNFEPGFELEDWLKAKQQIFLGGWA